MGTSREDIRRWLERGKEEGVTHVIVVCDTFDYEDYPVMVQPDEDVRKKKKEYDDDSKMSKVIEVYDLNMCWEEQLQGGKAMNY